MYSRTLSLPESHFFFWQTPAAAQVRRRHGQGLQTVEWQEEDLLEEGWRPLGTYHDASDPEHGEAPAGEGRNSCSLYCVARDIQRLLAYPVVRQPFIQRTTLCEFATETTDPFLAVTA